jgi:hypothetical protein
LGIIGDITVILAKTMTARKSGCWLPQPIRQRSLARTTPIRSIGAV